jgi:hypothetical protein
MIDIDIKFMKFNKYCTVIKDGWTLGYTVLGQISGGGEM